MAQRGRRLGSVPLQVLEHDGYQYSTLDLADPHAGYGASYGGTGCSQRMYIKLPEGWELVPDEPPALVEVLTRHRWGGAKVIVFANGKSYHTASVPGRRADPVDEPMLDTMKPDVGREQFKPRLQGKDARIMMRQRIEACIVDEDTETHSDVIIGNMWKKRRFTDCTVVCPGRELPCHRAVLVEASPVLEAALTGNMREATERRIEIKDAEPDIVEDMISFLYSGRLEEKARDPAHLAKLLSIGDQYGVSALVQACAKLLVNHLTPDTVVPVTRALRAIRDNPEVGELWSEVQKRLREDPALLDAVTAAV